MSVDPNVSILVVDDNRTMVRIIRNLLRQIGFENVDEAASGREGLDKLRNKTYNLIISDWNMEPMNGLDFLKEVRSDNTTRNLRFIMVTAETKPENVIEARKAGVDNYIAKPFTAETLLAKVNAVLGG